MKVTIAILSLFPYLSAFAFELSSALLKAGDVYFECTIISDVEPTKFKQTPFTHVRKYTAVRADVISPTKLSVRIGGKTFQVSSSSAKKTRLELNRERIEILLPEADISLDLKGKPLSRNGSLYIRPTLANAVREVGVTCH